MSEPICRIGDVDVTGYALGAGKGVGVQLTGPNGFVQLPLEDAVYLAMMLLKFSEGLMENPNRGVNG